jgi:hypothetical protein
VCGVKLPQAYPEFNENRNEFQNVDVESLWIHGRFMVVVGVLPTHVRRESRLEEVISCDAPHVIEFGDTRPTSQG